MSNFEFANARTAFPESRDLSDDITELLVNADRLLVSELAAELAETATTVKRNLVRMQEDGLVVVDRDEDDWQAELNV